MGKIIANLKFYYQWGALIIECQRFKYSKKKRCTVDEFLKLLDN